MRALATCHSTTDHSAKNLSAMTADLDRTADVGRAGEAGFTVIELLVGLSLLSLITVALFASLRYGIFAWGRGMAHVESVEHIAFAQNYLRQSIGDAYPMFSAGALNRGKVAFEGTNTSLRYLASSPIVLGAAGRSWFTLSLAPRDGRHDLVLDALPELADPQAASVSEKLSLVTDVGRLSFAYHGRTRSGRSPQWHDQWMDERTPPELVRIRIEFPQGDRRNWPELVIRPRITADVGCVYELLTKSCRGR
jgi:general secretion pathway protein J